MAHSARTPATTDTADVAHAKMLSAAKCRRKQYDGVRAALQFLRPLLGMWLRENEGKSELSSAQFALIHRVTDTGVPENSSCEGQLNWCHVPLLKDVAWEGLLRTVFSAFPHSAVSEGANGSLSVFPISATQTMSGDSSLWPESLVESYVAIRAQIHREHPSRDLQEQGYLHEAGLILRKMITQSAGLHKSVSERWMSLIDSYTLYMPDRSHIHEMENVTQEIAIGELLVDCLTRLGETPETNTLELVVDAGGGNGFLAAEVAERLHCPSLVIDPFFPSHSIDCCPRVWADTAARERPTVCRRQALSRIVALFSDITWDTDIAVDPDRCAFVAKHLCGTAIDACLARLEAQQRFPKILVLVPCCFNKGTYADYINKEFLQNVLHVCDADAYTNVARITDWNASLYQKLEPDGPSNGSRYSPVGKDRCGERSKRSMGHLVACPDALAGTVEAFLNRGRMQWLAKRGYTTELREYVPDCVTPKNKCILAYRTS